MNYRFNNITPVGELTVSEALAGDQEGVIDYDYKTAGEDIHVQLLWFRIVVMSNEGLKRVRHAWGFTIEDPQALVASNALGRFIAGRMWESLVRVHERGELSLSVPISLERLEMSISLSLANRKN